MSSSLARPLGAGGRHFPGDAAKRATQHDPCDQCDTGATSRCVLHPRVRQVTVFAEPMQTTR